VRTVVLLCLSTLTLCTAFSCDRDPAPKAGTADTDVTAPAAEPAAEESEPAQSPESTFDTDSWTTSVGLGGGAGGKFSGRRGSRATAEEYTPFASNGFVSVREQPLSTFAIDVDTAAYSNIRRFLREGRLPPVDAVRIEEMLNSFRYADATPTGDDPFAVHTEVAACPWNPERQLLRIALRSVDLDQDNVPPRNLVFLLDVSGSMRDPDKLPLLKRAMLLLAQTLRPRDRVSIVTYAGGAGLLLESSSGAEQVTIRDAIQSLRAGGSTNGSAGIEQAYAVARENRATGGINRVILATDGDFNVGVTDHEELMQLIEREAQDGVFLSVLGLGTGNLKDATMEQLADRGNGNYSYLDTIAEARKVLVSQAGATLVTVAKDVKIQIEFNPRFVESYRLVGYENRLLAARDFNDDSVDAGEIGAGHSVTALYEVVPAGAAAPGPAIDPLRYQESPPVVTSTDEASQRELLNVKLRYQEPLGHTSRLVQRAVLRPDADRRPSADFEFAAAVAGFGMLLRHSPYAGSMTYDGVLELAGEGTGERAEFVRLVTMARDIAATEPTAR